MKLTWLGHSAFRLETGASVIMIDPFLSGNPSFKGDPASAWQGATHVLLTHGHDDHIGDTVRISQETGAVLIAVYELAAHLHGKGAGKYEPVNTGGTIRTADFDVTFVRADHSSASGGVYLGNPCGLMIRCKAEAKTVYHMGDTDLFGDMALLNEIHAPEIGIVPIGDRFTMGGERAAFACRRFFNFQTVIPCHFGTFSMVDATADVFVKAMGDQGGRVARIRPGAAPDF